MIGAFTRGFVDGSLSTLGIVIGASAANSTVIISAAVGGAMANGVSNGLSAFVARGAEDYSELCEVEKAMVSRDLRGSTLDQEISKNTIRAGVTDGIATILGGAIPIAPYLLAPPLPAMLMAIGLVVGITFVFGLYLGRISRKSLLLSAARMAVFALVVAVVVYLVQLILVSEGKV